MLMERIRYLLLISLIIPLFIQATEQPSINMVFYRENADQLLIEAMERFEQETKIHVNLVFVGVNDLKLLLIKGELNDSLPDVVFAPSDFTALASDIHLSEIPVDLISSDTLKESLNSVRNNGVLYGIPIMGGNHLVLYYNKTFVKTPAKTWDELAKQAEELRGKGIEPIGWNYNEMYWFAAFAGTFGGYPVTDGKLTLDSEAYADALSFYKGLADSGLISAKCGYDCAHKDFIAKKYGYSINGEWAMADFEGALGDALGISVIPSIGQRPFSPMFSTAALIFPNHALTGPKKHSLTQLAQFMQERYFQDLSFTHKRFLPVNSNSFAQVVASGGENIKMLLLQLQQAFPMSSEPVMSNAWLGMRKGFERYMAGLTTAKEAAVYMQKFAERDYKNSQLNRN